MNESSFDSVHLPCVPNDNSCRLVAISETGAEGDEVFLAGREVNELNAGVGEPLQLVEVLSSPQGDALINDIIKR